MGGIKRIHIICVLSVIFTLLLLDQVYLHYQLSMPNPPFAHSLHLDDVRQVRILLILICILIVLLANVFTDHDPLTPT